MRGCGSRWLAGERNGAGAGAGPGPAAAAAAAAAGVTLEPGVTPPAVKQEPGTEANKRQRTG